jgi:hypothetical protein
MFIKVPNIKCQKSIHWDLSLIHADIQVDMKNLKGAFCNYANASKNAILGLFNSSVYCHSSSLLDC